MAACYPFIPLMKHRLQRANELIRRELGAIIQREIIFDDSPLVTVHQASVTPDLRTAHIYVGAVGPVVCPSSIIAQLEEHRTFLQAEMSKRVILKYTPRLYFHFDESIQRGTRVIGILESLELPDSSDDPSSRDS